jgi:hypothetical protein
MQIMNLTDVQKTTVRGWIESGLKLSEIQNRLSSEFGLTTTYMEVRFLVDDLKVMPKDPEPAKPVEPPVAPKPGPADPPPAEADALDETAGEIPALPPAGTGKVKLSLDTVAVPGTVASGQVTFSDGQTAQWYLDQMGRLGLSPKQKGYRPPPADVQAFQVELQREFEKLGF